MQAGSELMQMENDLWSILRQNEKLSKFLKKKFKSHKKSRAVSPIPTIMLFFPKSRTNRELLKSPKCRNLNIKLSITWHQCNSKMGQNGLKLICELKIT